MEGDVGGGRGVSNDGAALGRVIERIPLMAGPTALARAGVMALPALVEPPPSTSRLMRYCRSALFT